MSQFIIVLVIGAVAIIGGIEAKHFSAEKNATSTPATSTLSTSATDTAATSTGPGAFPDADYKQEQVTIGNETFNALVADTDVLQQTGLSYRNGLKNGQVMLFAFDKPDMLGFWMKDMHFSLDMVWLDSNFRIVTIAKNVAPETYPKVFFPARPAQYVIELTAGTIDRIGAREGDAVKVSGGK